MPVKVAWCGSGCSGCRAQRNGLIYVIDIRNGLYILRYTGPRWFEAADIHFLEGNSNLGDAVRLAGADR